MENSLVEYKFEGHQVRTHLEESGEVLFSGKDICQVLDISDHRQAIGKLDDDETRRVKHHGSNREETFVNESGLYSLILRSNKPEAKRFKKWVTSEVLPSIRKTGSYSLGANEPIKTIPPASEAFKALVSVAEVFGMRGNQAILSANRAAKLVTGIDFQNLLGTTHLLNEAQVREFTPTELGARFGISAKKFNMLLADLGFQERHNDSWCATKKGEAFAVLLDTGKKHSNGTPVTQLKWRESVVDELCLTGAQSA